MIIFARAVILVSLFFSLSSNCSAHYKDTTTLKPKGRHFNILMADLVDKEKAKLGGLALNIPTSLAVGQAKLESNNGKSLYARKWNNYFGLYGEKNKKRKILKFNSPQESVRFYLLTLLHHKGYERFRTALRQGVDDPTVLIKKVARTYAEDPLYYKKVARIVRDDGLTAYD